MKKEVIKFETKKEIEKSQKLREELTLAMIENKRVRRMIDLFLLILFLVFITYTTL